MSDHDSIFGALTASARPLAERFRTHRSSFLARPGVESLHQLRVTARRARALLRLARRLGLAPGQKPLRKGLRKLGKQTNALRDLDVLAMAWPHYLDAAGAGAPHLGRGMLEAVEERRTAERTCVEEWLRSETVGTTLERWRALNKRWERLASTSPTLRETFFPEVGRLLQKTLERARDTLEDPSDEEVHRLRVQGKRLRYTAEILGPRADTHRLTAGLVEELKKFQDVLGEANDLRTHRALLERLVADSTTPGLQTVGRAVANHLDRHSALLRQEAIREIEQFVELASARAAAIES